MFKQLTFFLISLCIGVVCASCTRENRSAKVQQTKSSSISQSKDAKYDSLEYKLKRFKFILGNIMGAKINADSLDEALTLANYLQLLAPDDPQIIFSKGFILERQGHRDRAVHYYRKACLIYDSLGADTIYTLAINRAACIQAAYGEKAYRKELRAIWRKHKKNVYKDWDKKLSDEDWHLLWDDFDYRDFSYCTLAPIEISKINKILYGVELEDK